MHDLEFLFRFFQKKEKGMQGTRISESCCHRNEKGNMLREFNFSFPGRSKYDEIS